MSATDSKRERGAEKQSHSATDEPWEKPGQSSQNEDYKPTTPNVIEQEKQKKGIR